jgi:hypothetical protein
VRALWHEFPLDNTTWTIGKQNGGQKRTMIFLFYQLGRAGGGGSRGVELIGVLLLWKNISEMEFFNDIFRRGSGHKLESSQT